MVKCEYSFPITYLKENKNGEHKPAVKFYRSKASSFQELLPLVCLYKICVASAGTAGTLDSEADLSSCATCI